MTQIDHYKAAKDHNDRILRLWSTGEISRVEALASVKFLKDVGNHKTFKILQPREEGAKGLLNATTRRWYKGPLQIVLECLQYLPGCTFPYSKDPNNA